jgi:phenylalanyl-tRNA synthetase beta chain
MNWISEFVDLSGFDKKALIHNFTLSTAEVEDIIVKGEDTYGVIVAEIKSVENHPNSKKLHLLKVDNGRGLVDIVCGAPNVRVGMKVALATDGGAVMGHKISAATVAGYTSYGMCCSESELGISDDHSGIMEIFEDVPLGTDIKKIYDIDDIIFEVDNKSLTNRPDLWSHYGIAREFATITGRELKPLPVYDLSEFDNLPKVDIDVKNTELVYRYSAIKVENIQRKISPVNMRIRLYYCGSRAINFLADLTNYVMLEVGQPMHAFDNRKVDKVEVQTFNTPFAFTTLDGVERQIDTEMLMITSCDVPVAIAGVMGGDASKIEDDTSSLLLESATFSGVSVRKTTTRLSLRTDASMRYEKMLDPELCKIASARLLKILFECDKDAKVISSFTDSYVNKYEKITLKFDKHYVNRYTGIDIPNETIEKTLRGLGFEVNRVGDDYTVVVPSWRSTKDVTIKADIIEEITRIYGYDNFEVFTSECAVLPVREQTRKTVEDRLTDVLVKNYNFHEVHSYIWSDSKKEKELGIATTGGVRVINAQTPDHQYIRSSMIPTLLSFVRENRAYSDSFAIFEIGHTVDGYLENGKCNEKKKLGAVLFSKAENEEALFMKAADVIRTLSSDVLHKTPSFVKTETKYGYQHPKNTFAVSIEGCEIGILSVLHPEVLSNIDKKCSVAYFELSTEQLAKIEEAKLQYVEPSKFPAIEIDLTYNASIEDLDFEQLIVTAKAQSTLLKSVVVKDVYTTDDACALTLRYEFSSNERTLTKQELQEETDKISNALKSFNLIPKF